MKQEEWAHRLENRLADHQEPVSRDLWADIEASLPAEAGGRRRFIALRRWSIAAAVALVAVGGTYLWWQGQEPQATGQAVAEVRGKGAEPLQTEPPAETGRDNGGMPQTQPLAMAAPTKAGTPLTMATPTKAEAPIITAGPENPGTPAEQPDKDVTAKTDDAEAAKSQEHPEESQRLAASLTRTPVPPLPRTPAPQGRHLSLRLYASSGMTGLDGRNAVRMSPQMAALYDYTNAQPTAGAARTRSIIYLSGHEEQQQHAQPVSIGLTASYPLSPRLSIATGLAYTRLNSTFTSLMYDYQVQRHQTLHYLGIPLSLQWQVWGYRRLKAYLAAGIEADWNIKADTETGHVAQTMEKDRMQWSVGGSAGLQYDILPLLGIYAEPGIRYHFDNGSDVRNFFKDRPTNFNLQIGLRFNLK